MKKLTKQLNLMGFYSLKKITGTAQGFSCQFCVHVAFIRQYELGRDTIVGYGSRHKIAQNGGSIWSIQNQII